MATKPTPGGSDGTYGTELNAFLDESLASDGKIKTEALQTDSTAPVADAALTNKKYVDDLVILDASGVVMHDAEGGFNNCDLNGTKTKVYTKYFTGTLDADSSTSVAHGITSALTKILSVVFMAEEQGNSFFRVSEHHLAANAALIGMDVVYDATNVTVAQVGTNMQSGDYRIKIDYIL